MSNDWLVRQYEQAARSLACFMLGREYDQYEIFDEAGKLSQSGFILHGLRKMVLAGDINGAENRLFEIIEQEPREEYLGVALDFYEELNEMSDAALAACRFTRAEIVEGLQEIHKIYELANRPPGSKG